MIFAALSSPSISWLLWEALICFVAGIGGVLVFWGLWIEGPPDSEKSRRGWKMLMFGIFIEIVVAVVFSARDGLQARLTSLEIAKNDPFNQTVSEVSATAVIELKGSGLKEQEQHSRLNGFRWDSIIGTRGDIFTNRVNLSEGWLVSEGYNKMFAYNSERGNNTQYSLRYHLEDLGVDGTNSSVKQINLVKTLAIRCLFFPTNSEITWGRVTLTVNSVVQKSFSIPPQNYLTNFDDPFFVVYATNSTEATLIQSSKK